MKITYQYKTIDFLDRVIIIPQGERVWDSDAVVITSKIGKMVVELLNKDRSYDELVEIIENNLNIERRKVKAQIKILLLSLRRSRLIDDWQDRLN